MKIAVLGGGFTGLTSAYYLAKKGHEITLFEKENILGGLSSGFKNDQWDWPLERTYHHLLASDDVIIDFAKEVGFNKIFFQSPETASLYATDSNSFRIFPLDTPQDLLRFPLLSLPNKLRAGMVIAFLKFSPFFSSYEKESAQKFLEKTMGKRAWEVLWQELFRKKFGKYAGVILTSFIWARIKKRSKNLGYIEGGFQAFIDYLEKLNQNLGVHIRKEVQIERIEKRGEKFKLYICHPDRSPDVTSGRSGGIPFDAIISTLPTPIIVKTTQNLLPEDYLKRLSKIKYLNAVNLILETENPILDKTYWLSICAKELPFTILAQHTNFIDKKHYNNKHISYIGHYVDSDDKLLKMSKEEVLNYFLPYFKKITNNYNLQPISYYLFRAPFAQPIFDKDFVISKPDFETPVKNFYIANLDMTYPYDRGTNYAVELGKKVSEMI